jgi:hypothetical protein
MLEGILTSIVSFSPSLSFIIVSRLFLSSDKHESRHKPQFHQGVVIKMNANQRYATTAATRSLLRELARRSQTPLQDFVVRNDGPCGSTIGPIIASHTGLRTIGKFVLFWLCSSSIEGMDGFMSSSISR